MKAHIGLPENDIKKIADLLQVILADEHVILTKTRNYHWNIKGPRFMELHKFYEDQYKVLRDIIDQIAERITQLGHQSNGTMKDFLSTTRLKEGPYEDKQDAQISHLLADHEAFITNLRKDIEDIDEKLGDAVTTDLLTGFMGQHEKMAWMLRAFLG
ncbi:Dps family protein [Emticicia sp. BO119]|uniref:Dps family protein n=1 Tax=Emticicia sp. BO119 TaxID=2757768 RepID=UPI0015F03026|nr:DNA starvation/stationary phase protection protein [Emticicia sp. BO119]MBA4853995.1 DNA starvation/stationary phase protection protein [Emticicia sp. BO119]